MNAFANLYRSRAVTVALAALVGGLGLMMTNGLSKADEPTSSPVVVVGVTKPSEERQLRFAAPGIVAKVNVKDGALVKAKDVLAVQDTRQDEFQLKDLLREAESNEKIAYSEADLASKRVDLKRKQELFKDRAASQTELDQAELAEKLALAQVKLAQMEHDQKGFEAEKEKVKIDQMTIYSPIDGIIEKVNIGEGEMGDPQSREGAITVGQWNPMWLEIKPPSEQAAQLKPDQVLQVSYDGKAWMDAKIIFFDKVEPMSDTQMIRLEMVNPNNKVPGLHMQVKLPVKLAGVANGQ